MLSYARDFSLHFPYARSFDARVTGTCKSNISFGRIAEPIPSVNTKVAHVSREDKPWLLNFNSPIMSSHYISDFNTVTAMSCQRTWSGVSCILPHNLFPCDQSFYFPTPLVAECEVLSLLLL
jgi:hypothetical protein